MFSATVDFARIYYASQTLQNAAWAGAMYASGTAITPGSPPDVTTAAKTAACAEAASLSPPPTPDGVMVSVSATAATVTVDYDFPLLTAVLVPSMTVHLERSVTMGVAPRPGQ
jgi:hypothetical protein